MKIACCGNPEGSLLARPLSVCGVAKEIGVL